MTALSSARAALWKITRGRGVAGSDGVGQRVSDQLGPQMIGHGVADDPLRGDVDHCYVGKALPGADVADVLAPAQVQLAARRSATPPIDPVAAPTDSAPATKTEANQAGTPGDNMSSAAPVMCND